MRLVTMLTLAILLLVALPAQGEVVACTPGYPYWAVLHFEEWQRAAAVFVAESGYGGTAAIVPTSGLRPTDGQPFRGYAVVYEKWTGTICSNMPPPVIVSSTPGWNLRNFASEQEALTFLQSIPSTQSPRFVSSHYGTSPFSGGGVTAMTSVLPHYAYVLWTDAPSATKKRTVTR